MTNHNEILQETHSRQTLSERTCWICLATEEDNPLSAWVHPCKCRGTTKWVHQACLSRWIDEKQSGNVTGTVRCTQCQTPYIIVFPQMSIFANILEMCDNSVKRLSPFMAAGVFVGSLYWAAVTYGAVTFLQIYGHREGLALIENSDPLVLLIGLPVIPVVLVLCRMINWEDALLRFIRHTRRVARTNTFINFSLTPVETEQDDTDSLSLSTPQFPDSSSVTRTFCGALLLPTISCIMGHVFYDSVENPLYRAVLGGLTFTAVKGVLKIYLRHQQRVRKKNRRIVDYTEENARIYFANNSVSNLSNALGGNNPAIVS